MKIMFLVNILLAGLWMLLVDSYSTLDALIGFLVGFLALGLVRLVNKQERYHTRIFYTLWLLVFFVYELISSSVKVLWDIVTPQHKSLPGFIAMKLDARTPMEIFFTANLISLTPGTLSIALSADNTILYIHAMFVHDKEASIASLKNFEAHILRAFR